jgi:hypothetical protein
MAALSQPAPLQQALDRRTLAVVEVVSIQMSGGAGQYPKNIVIRAMAIIGQILQNIDRI